MSDLVVVSGCSRSAGMLETYRAQLKAADILFHVEHIEVPNNVGDLKLKMDWTKTFADKFQNYKIVFSDAWDVRFYGTKEEVLAKIPDFGVLQAAERNCWPDAYLQGYFPETNTPWRFVNGGLWCGTSESLWQWADRIQREPTYFPKMVDQQWFNFERVKGNRLINLDSQANLFYCMIHEAGELEFRNGRPHNSLCKTWPNFIHANGKYPIAPVLMMEEASLMYGRVLAALEEEKCKKALSNTP